MRISFGQFQPVQRLDVKVLCRNFGIFMLQNNAVKHLSDGDLTLFNAFKYVNCAITGLRGG